MNAGALRHLVTIQAVTETKAIDGSTVQTWADKDKVWANITPLRGREFMDAMQVNGDVTHRVRMRWWPSTLTRKHRFAFDSRTFNITGVLNRDERKKEVEVMCKEVT